MSGSYAIFVDAAFLWASVGELLFGTNDRSRLTCDHESLIEELIDRTGDASDRDLLRLYWYDGAVNKVPSAEQKRVGLLPNVKLRLGRVVGGHQKGVDSLIVLDLLKLAGTRMVDVIYLLSGDDDLTEGVREAQACGVRVVLLGAATELPRHSESMVLEADGVELWPASVWAPHFSRPASERAGRHRVRPAPGRRGPRDLRAGRSRVQLPLAAGGDPRRRGAGPPLPTAHPCRRRRPPAVGHLGGPGPLGGRAGRTARRLLARARRAGGPRVGPLAAGAPHGPGRPLTPRPRGPPRS